MQIEDQTQETAVPFSDLAPGDGFKYGGVIYAKKDASTAIRFPEVYDHNIAPGDLVLRRDLTLVVTLPA